MLLDGRMCVWHAHARVHSMEAAERLEVCEQPRHVHKGVVVGLGEEACAWKHASGDAPPAEARLVIVARPGLVERDEQQVAVLAPLGGEARGGYRGWVDAQRKASHKGRSSHRCPAEPDLGAERTRTLAGCAEDTEHQRRPRPSGPAGVGQAATAVLRNGERRWPAGPTPVAIARRPKQVVGGRRHAKMRQERSGGY